MPMWCYAAECRAGSHHRIVRVPPGESVVLNSAEHAPYLLILEILNDDLNFNTSDRRNQQLVKSILQRSEQAFSKPSDVFAAVGYSSAARPTDAQNPSPNIEATASNTPPPEQEESSPALKPNLFSDADGPDLEEEVDLVEQVYGDLSVRQAPDVSESYVLPAPKNRALDIAAWSKRGSSPSSPALTPSISSNGKTPEFTFGSPTPQQSSAFAHPPVLSLDEYSERMRTAAVMLAQLNASASQNAQTANSMHRSSNSLSGDLNSPANGSIDLERKTQSAALHSHVRSRLPPSEVQAIRERIMKEMIALEEERMERMRATSDADGIMSLQGGYGSNLKLAEDEQIIRRVLDKVDPSAVVFQESWAAKKVWCFESSQHIAML
jgi:phosphatidylinositol 4-kinase